MGPQKKFKIRSNFLSFDNVKFGMKKPTAGGLFHAKFRHAPFRGGVWVSGYYKFDEFWE